MKKVGIFVALSMICAVFCCVTAAAAKEEAPHAGYIVKLREDHPRLYAREAEDFLVVKTLREAEEIPEQFVEFIEPNYFAELFDVGEEWTPNDPYYADYQWSLQEIGGLAPYRSGLRGEGAKVGFVDSGVLVTHEDLAEAKISGENFNADGLSYDQDTYGHGTFSVGVLAAGTDNGVGLSGMAPEAEIRAYRIFSRKNTTMSAEVRAIDKAVEDGCQVLNLSLGTPNSSELLRQAVERAVEAGVVVVAAVGNDGTEQLQYPAAYPGVIGVGSVDSGLTVSAFSQRNESVFVTAPGGGVAGLGCGAPDSYRLDLADQANSGTSFAAPIVTALAAIALGYDGDLTAEGVRYLLETTALDRGEAGYDTDYGHGVVNAAAFVERLMEDFSITYVLDGGTLPEDALLTYRVTDESAELPIPVREGFRFAGWYTESGCSADAVEQIPAGSVGERVFYAAWEEATVEDPGIPEMPEEEDLVPAKPSIRVRETVFPFADVSPEASCRKALEALWSSGVITADAGALFEGETILCREEAWLLLGRMAGENLRGPLSARSWVMEMEISDGNDAGGAVTWQQLATMLWRWQGQKKAVGMAGDAAPYAREAVAWLRERGVWDPEGIRDPRGEVSRRDAVILLAELLQTH